jgi:hypothetical protein
VAGAEHAALARRAIEAAGKTVAPEASTAELAAHGARLAAGSADQAAPAELTAEGRGRSATVDRHQAAPKPTPRTARPPRPAAAGFVSDVRSAPRQLAASAASAASGGAVQGNTAVGRLMGAGILGLGVLILGSMMVKRDFAINLGGGLTAPKAAPNLAHTYVPLYQGPGVAVVVKTPSNLIKTA